MSWLGSILSGVGRTGSDIQEGKLGQQDQQLAAFKKQQMQLDSQLRMQELQQRMREAGLNEQLNKAPQVVHSYKGSDGKLHNVVRDPITGALSDQAGGEEAPAANSLEEQAAQFKKVFGRDPTETEKAALAGTTPKAPPSPKFSGEKVVRDPKSPTGWSYAMTNEADPTKVVMTPGAPSPYIGKEKPGGDKDKATINPMLIKAMADKWQNEGIKPPSKYQADVEEYMYANGQKAKIKLNQTEQMISDSVKQVTPMIDRLSKFIEENKLQDENNWVMGNHSVLANHARMWGYGKGKDPDAQSAELIKDAAAIQVMGARPWMTMGRSKYMYETVRQHLPSPTDTPKLLYEKINWLRDNVLTDAMQSLPNAGEAGGAAKPAATASGPATPFEAPKGAPAAPKDDGAKLKANGKVIAISKGGTWVAP